MLRFRVPQGGAGDVIKAMSEQTTPGRPKGALGDLVKAESMIQLAVALPLGCVVGWFLGHWLDGKLHQNWIGVVGILLGAAGGFLQIYNTASRYMKDPE